MFLFGIGIGIGTYIYISNQRSYSTMGYKMREKLNF